MIDQIWSLTWIEKKTPENMEIWFQMSLQLMQWVRQDEAVA
jgi:hypothetical protein